MTIIPHRVASPVATLKPACSTCILRRLCLPAGLGESELKRLETVIGPTVILPDDRFLFQAGDPATDVYALRAGSVKTMVRAANGRWHITGFHLPGDLVGLNALASNPHSSSAQTLERTSLCRIPRQRLEQLSITLPGLAHRLLALLSAQIRADEQQLALLGKQSAEGRVATLLLELATRLEARGLTDAAYTLSMSRNDMGNYLGLAVETVSRVLGRLQRQGIISLQPKHYIVLHKDRLHALTGRPSARSDYLPTCEQRDTP